MRRCQTRSLVRPVVARPKNQSVVWRPAAWAFWESWRAKRTWMR